MVEQYPSDLENHLRLAEAYVNLNDYDPAIEALCRCIAQRGSLRPDNQRLLERLIDTVGKGDVECGAPQPRRAPAKK
jgi:thioredoxin-like negative regulator of GroEL